MDEIIVRIARTIACETRLRILSLIAQEPETTPSAIASKLGVPLAQISIHMRRLATAGLVVKRRSGTWCYCTPKSPYSEKALSGRIASWLYQALRTPKRTMRDCGPVQLRNGHEGDALAQLHEVIFDAATAFTDLRRLQILRRLTRGDCVTVQTLVQDLSMSPAAVSRQTDKLIRRGYIQASPAGTILTYELTSRAKTPIHARLFEIVRSEWTE